MRPTHTEEAYVQDLKDRVQIEITERRKLNARIAELEDAIVHALAAGHAGKFNTVRAILEQSYLDRREGDHVD